MPAVGPRRSQPWHMHSRRSVVVESGRKPIAPSVRWQAEPQKLATKVPVVGLFALVMRVRGVPGSLASVCPQEQLRDRYWRIIRPSTLQTVQGHT
jgi:hypothetical protein